MQREQLEYFNEQFLKKNRVHYRHYQNNIVKGCMGKNSLVVLPTGLGKTIIGILLIAHSLKKYNRAKSIILAPTRPLVAQHKASCEKFLKIDSEKIALFTGKTPPDKRIVLFNSSRIIISTPQVIKNDVMRGRYDLSQVSLIVFDEAHKTKGNYAYNFISKEYIETCSDPLILGLTASPGKDNERIQEICDNLCIENIVFKNYRDKDVKDYVYDIDTYISIVDLPLKTLELSTIWYNLFEKYLRFFIKGNLIAPNKRYYSKLDFLRIVHDLTLALNYENYTGSEIIDEELLENLFYREPKIIDIVRENQLDIPSVYSYCSSCISILHAKDLIETQNISLFKSFLDRIINKANRDILSAKRIANSEHFSYIYSTIEEDLPSDLSHPKIKKVISTIKEEFEEFGNKRILIFTQYREMAEFLKKKLQSEFNEQVKIEKFIGQVTKKEDAGFSQQMQIEILQKFREGIVNILIATSVAEEGLDIPNVDAIIFYEPVPSEIRLIQRRGRTGRHAPGRCYIIITEGTVDVPFYQVARRKENTMNSVLRDPELLVVNNQLNRKRISCGNLENTISEFEITKNFKERCEKEKEHLANRSIEEIISELDKFANNIEFDKFKESGVTFFSDLIHMNESMLRRNIFKIKGKKKKNPTEKKQYLNKNLKTLVNIAKTYCDDEKLDLSRFQELAEEEDITEKKFRIHFNQACYLGYLKIEKNKEIAFIKDYC